MILGQNVWGSRKKNRIQFYLNLCTRPSKHGSRKFYQFACSLHFIVQLSLCNILFLQQNNKFYFNKITKRLQKEKPRGFKTLVSYGNGHFISVANQILFRSSEINIQLKKQTILCIYLSNPMSQTLNILIKEIFQIDKSNK